jgi:regulator of protease activity HflC (stomatin/prohibitin superfamily)
MNNFKRKWKKSLRYNFLKRLGKFFIILASIALLMLFFWSFVEVLLGSLHISLPKPIVIHTVFFGVLAFISYLILSTRVLSEGVEAIVQRLGEYRRTLKPGLNFVVPFLDTVLVEASLREQSIDIAPQTAFTKDGVLIMIDSLVYWRIIDLYSAYYRIEDLEDSLSSTVITNILSEIAQVDLREALASRSRINQAVLNIVTKKAASWGIEILRVEIQEIRLSDSVMAGLEAEQSAESLKRAGEVRKQTAMLDAEIRHLSAIQDAKTEIEISELRTQAYESGILLSMEKEKELREKVEKKIEEEKEKFVFNNNFNLSQLAEIKAQAESETMNNSADSSQSITIDGNITGSTVNLDSISGDVTNAINQLSPGNSTSGQPNLRELLLQLQNVVEESKELAIEDKTDLLEQVKVLTEAKNMSEPKKREGLLRKAKKIFDATIDSLPKTAVTFEACSKLLPLILKALSLPI